MTREVKRDFQEKTGTSNIVFRFTKTESGVNVAPFYCRRCREEFCRCGDGRQRSTNLEPVLRGGQVLNREVASSALSPWQHGDELTCVQAKLLLECTERSTTDIWAEPSLESTHLLYGLRSVLSAGINPDLKSGVRSDNRPCEEDGAQREVTQLRQAKLILSEIRNRLKDKPVNESGSIPQSLPRQLRRSVSCIVSASTKSTRRNRILISSLSSANIRHRCPEITHVKLSPLWCSTNGVQPSSQNVGQCHKNTKQFIDFTHTKSFPKTDRSYLNSRQHHLKCSRDVTSLNSRRDENKTTSSSFKENMKFYNGGQQERSALSEKEESLREEMNKVNVFLPSKLLPVNPFAVTTTKEEKPLRQKPPIVVRSVSGTDSSLVRKTKKPLFAFQSSEDRTPEQDKKYYWVPLSICSM